MDRSAESSDTHEAATAAPPSGLDLLSDDAWNDLSYVDFVARLEEQWPEFVRAGRGPRDGAGRYVRFCRKCAARCPSSEREYLEKQPYTCEACGHRNLVLRDPNFAPAAAWRDVAWGVALLGLLSAVVVFPALGALGVVGVVFMWIGVCVSGAVGLLLIAVTRTSVSRLKCSRPDSSPREDAPK